MVRITGCNRLQNIAPETTSSAASAAISAPEKCIKYNRTVARSTLPLECFEGDSFCDI